MGIQINGQTDTVTAIDGSLNVGGDVTIPGVLTYDDVTNVDSIGVITSRSGIHVSSGSSIGIGTDNPARDFEISGTSANAPVIRLSDTDTALSDGELSSAIEFAQNDVSDPNSVNASIRAIGDGSIGNLALAFHAGQDVEKVRITSAGRVGIGTDGPAGKLHISSGESGDCALIIEADTDNNEETDNPYIEFRQDGGLAHSKVGLEDNQLVIANSVISGEGIVFKVGQSGTPGWQQATERVSIGTSETVCTGFYRATNIPYMRAGVTPTVAFGTGEIVHSFGTVQQNSNFNSYDNSTGEYTCPVNGLYWASAGITGTNVPSNTTNSLAWLQQQGSGATGTPATYGSNYRESYVTCSMSGVFNCLAGDIITVRTTNITIMASSPRNYFTVAFLG